MPSEQYIPGVCNIGHAERRLRRIVGWVGLVVTIAAWAILALLDVPAAWRVLLFIPATAAALGLLQHRARFCAKYALEGVFSLGERAGESEHVADAENRRRDRGKALRIVVASLLIGVAVGLAGWLVPI